MQQTPQEWPCRIPRNHYHKPIALVFTSAYYSDCNYLHFLITIAVCLHISTYCYVHGLLSCVYSHFWDHLHDLFMSIHLFFLPIFNQEHLLLQNAQCTAHKETSKTNRRILTWLRLWAHIQDIPVYRLCRLDILLWLFWEPQDDLK